MRRVVILGRGGAGKSALARRLGELTGLPVIELDSLFWLPGPAPADPADWRTRQLELTGRDAWIIDGDLGPYDDALPIRLSAADTIIVLNLSLARRAWRTLRRGREQPEYWRWILTYRRRYLPAIMTAIARHAPGSRVAIARGPRAVRRLIAEIADQAP